MAVATATEQPGSKHNVQVARQAYYDKISKFNMAPLWEVLKDLVTKEPKTSLQPTVWKFGDVKRLMLEAGDVISAEEAERRVLVLENPGMPGKARITNSLFAGIQLILPGEIADAHQHVSSAIRFVLEGEGAYTAVEGEKTQMKHGDFIITANWAPHDHGNPGKQPVMWLDVLDMPTVNHFEASFATHFDEKMQKTNHADGDFFERYASGVLPDGAPATMNRSPVINYPYAKMRPILERLKNTGDVRQTPRRARALRQSDQWRVGASDDGRLPRVAPEGLQGRVSIARPTRLFSRSPRDAVPLSSTASRTNGASTMYLLCRPGSAIRTIQMTSWYCSRSQIALRRNRSACGGRGTESGRTKYSQLAWPGLSRPIRLRMLRADLSGINRDK